MANIDLEIKKTAELSITADVIDTNNNERKRSTPSVLTIEEMSESEEMHEIEEKMSHVRVNNGEAGKEVHQIATPPPTPSPVPSGSDEHAQPTQANGDCFKNNFKLFAKFGDSKSSGEAITLSNSDKWFKQAKIIDGKTMTTVDTGIYFKKVAKGKRSLTLAQYNEFLDTLAKMKKLQIDDLKDKLRTSGSPSTNRTTTAVVGGAIGRLTDHTKYTGTHKERFDDKGKGKGKAGREDIKVDSGYVTGFKA